MSCSLQRELALLHLKFERLQYFSVKEHHISSLVVYLLKIPTTTSSQLNIATWNGQVHCMLTVVRVD